MAMLALLSVASFAPAARAQGPPVVATAAPDLVRAWAERDAGPGGLERALILYERAAERSDATPLVFERLVRLRYFQANFRREENSEPQAEGFDLAVRDGLRGVSRAALEGGKAAAEAADLDDALDKIGKNAAAILYWTALSYGQTIPRRLSVFKQPGAAKRLRRLFERCLALEETYFHGGPHRVLSDWHAKAPGILGGDSGEAREHAEAAVRLGPRFAENYVVRAENVWLPAGDRAKYEADLETALALADDAAGEDGIPEQREAKKKAKRLLAAIDEKF